MCTWTNWSNITRCWSHQASVILFGSVQSCVRQGIFSLFLFIRKQVISTRLSFQYISLSYFEIWNVRLIFHTTINAPDKTTDSYCAHLYYRLNELPICQGNLINLPSQLKFNHRYQVRFRLQKKKIFTYTQIEMLNNPGPAVKQDQSNFQQID